ncbi:hypothetical protein HOU74_gp35 [Pectobacterium phage Phoria]|uniref:AP2/ERF domain-containing protein n=1 Tax=Pectobacterium phage Phoria TaxID=2489634 RepID=A0A3G8FJF7_9CAUD|nr:hypothetical protein HOU74_gp35 [Pectobacterium phage Phoria]AZF94941.1 hypothetical protein [Pectobacterium phage Phoria]
MFNLFSKMLHYNPVTGELTRLRTGGGQLAGTIAGSTNKAGYTQVGVAGKLVYAHRIAWMLYYGEQPPAFIDHIDGDKSNNSIANLRAASKRENAHNQPKTAANTSGFKGVSRVRGRYQAQIRINSKHHHLGYYDTPEDAALAYEQVAKDTHGEFYHEPTHS